MIEFKQYQRKQVAELRPFQEGEQLDPSVSISQADRNAGSPKVGDMIARNPKNHEDQWLVSQKYFEDNFGPASQPKENLSFGEAIDALKQGKRVSRTGWNGKGMFIFMRPSDVLPRAMVVQQVKSLPQSVKDHIHFNTVDYLGNDIPLEHGEPVTFGAYICMYAADKTIVNGWLASQTDILSEDWCILD